MRVLDHGCWMCRDGNTAKLLPLSLLLCGLYDSMCFPLPTIYFCTTQPTRHKAFIPLEPKPLECLPLDHSLRNIFLCEGAFKENLARRERVKIMIIQTWGVTLGKMVPAIDG